MELSSVGRIIRGSAGQHWRCHLSLYWRAGATGLTVPGLPVRLDRLQCRQIDMKTISTVRASPLLLSIRIIVVWNHCLVFFWPFGQYTLYTLFKYECFTYFNTEILPLALSSSYLPSLAALQQSPPPLCYSWHWRPLNKRLFLSVSSCCRGAVRNLHILHSSSG